MVPIGGFLYWRLLTGNAVHFGPPHLTPESMQLLVPIVAVVLIGFVLVFPLAWRADRRTCATQASEIDVTFDDVVGLGPVKDEVVKTLNLFLAYQTFRDEMGGNPRKAILFEGPPGTGKTYMAKAMAKEAGVPYLFVSSTAFQSMYYGQTGRKIRNYFKALRKAAREEGGAIGFIEEIDAIAGARSGMRGHSRLPSGLDEAVSMAIEPSGVSEGISGVVNELLIQLQSFDHPTFGQRFRGVVRRHGEPLVAGAPADSASRRRAASNILVDRRDEPRRRPRSRVAPSGSLRPVDPLRSAEPLRPARDRRLLPRPQGARARARQGRAPRPARRDDHRLHAGDDRAPVRRRRSSGRCATDATRWTGTTCSRRSSPRRSGSSSRSSTRTRRSCAIATHESGHAVVAHLVGHDRKLEVLSIVKRRDALGSARALRQGRALDEDPDRAHRLDQDRVRRHDRGGAVLR